MSAQTDRQTDRPIISILVPCYNEEAVLNKFYERISEVVSNIKKYDFEFVFVNDGSKDKTLHIMRGLRDQDKRVSYINLSRNFGKEIAMIAGIDYLQGEAAIIMDADLQDPPELIPEMISWWEMAITMSVPREEVGQESLFSRSGRPILFIRFCRKCPMYQCSVT